VHFGRAHPDPLLGSRRGLKNMSNDQACALIVSPPLAQRAAMVDRPVWGCVHGGTQRMCIPEGQRGFSPIPAPDAITGMEAGDGTQGCACIVARYLPGGTMPVEQWYSAAMKVVSVKRSAQARRPERSSCQLSRQLSTWRSDSQANLRAGDRGT